ncbi:hypothetical protein PM3016_958 [Paenibacillus mucilaginosus 3016]|uniref:Uncharacterized protein n=1 Tax=Paenibacillus mucilaginosus 3016 TaxID=1116391 RepID=H6NBU8_9BACL|nr:hypothetical protein [Paenibacillus mucilaginosus]AFC27899.1 hypothetical protein PM3016_958 [Paenibacillus mucilaginosus 3016]WFA16763.1 hypothetical protein ERY13_05115 [Paenibacillus mucilaginosus]
MALGIVPLTAVHTRKNAFDLYQTGDGYPAYPQQNQGPEYGDMKPVEPFDEIEKKKQEAKELQEQEQRRKESDPDKEEKKKMLQQLDMLKSFYTNFTPEGMAITADQTKEGLKQLLSKAIEQKVQNDKMVWDSKLHQFRMEISREAYEKQTAALKEEEQKLTASQTVTTKEETAAAGSATAAGSTAVVAADGRADSLTAGTTTETTGGTKDKTKEHGSTADSGLMADTAAVGG